MKRILFTLIALVSLSVVHAQNVVKELMLDLNDDALNTNNFFVPYYANFGEKGILIRQGTKYELYDSDLNKKWEATIPEHDIDYKLYGMQYFKIVCSNDFIYILDNYSTLFQLDTKNKNKTFLTQLDFNGKIVSSKSFDDLIPKDFVIIDCFASSDGCHYVSTDFYRGSWKKSDPKKDFFGTFSASGLNHSTKQINLPFDVNTDVFNNFEFGSEYYYNYYYNDGEVGKSYYGDSTPSRLILTAKIKKDKVESFLSQSLVINKNGELTKPVILDSKIFGQSDEIIWPITLYCEEEKMFLSFVVMNNDNHERIIRFITADQSGVKLKSADMPLTTLIDISKTARGKTSGNEFKTYIQSYILPVNFFYDNFNHCFAFGWMGCIILMDKSLDVIGTYGGEEFNCVNNSNGYIYYPNLYNRFSLSKNLRPYGDFVAINCPPSSHNLIKETLPNSFDYLSKNPGVREKKEYRNYYVIESGDFQFLIIDDMNAKKTKIVKLAKS